MGKKNNSKHWDSVFTNCSGWDASHDIVEARAEATHTAVGLDLQHSSQSTKTMGTTTSVKGSYLDHFAAIKH
jgi:hypothetical protein